VGVPADLFRESKSDLRLWAVVNSALRGRAVFGPRHGIQPDAKAEAQVNASDSARGSGATFMSHRSVLLAGQSMSTPTQKTGATAEAGSGKGRFYRPLRTRFRHNGFDYRQIAREGDAAIYEQRGTGCAEPTVCYEVIRIRERAGFHIGDRYVKPAEVYPNSEAWG